MQIRRRLPLLLALVSCIGAWAPPMLHAQSEFTVPVLPPLNYKPELVGETGKWYINAPTIPGWHYSLEQYDITDGLWKPFPDGKGQYYGNNLPIKFYVVDGPMPPEGGFTGPPPVGTPTWQLRWLTFRIEMQKNGLGTAFRISRDQTFYPASPDPIPADAWDAVLTETLPSLPTGFRTFMFQGWDDPVNKIMWQTDVQVTITDGPPPGDSIPTTPENSPEETAEREVFQKIKAQLIGAMITPFVPSPPVPPGPKSLIRLRRTAIDSNGNGIPNWWEIQNNFEDLAAFDASQSNPDGDGLSTADEFFYGTNPRLPDTDGDGLNDGAEIAGGTDPLLFDLPLMKLEYAWREAEGTDARVYEDVTTRTVTGTATNGTAVRPWSMAPPAGSNTIVNVALALNNNMGTFAGGTEMLWSAWETWSGSATARFRQTFSGDASANTGLPLRHHKFHRREIKVRLSANRPMPVVWKVHLRKTLVSASGRPGTAWESQTLYTDPEVLTLGLGQQETILTLSPAETPNPGLPTTVFPDNEALVEYTLISNGTFALSNGSDSDGDTIPNATEFKIRTNAQNASSDGNGIRDADSRVAGLSSLTMALVSHRRGLVYHGSNTKGSTPFTSTGTSPPADRTAVLTSYTPLNALLNGLTFPSTAPATLIEWRNPASVSASGTATKIPDLSSAVCLHATLQQQSVWGVLRAAPTEATTRTCLKLTRRTTAGGSEQTTAEVVTFKFNADHAISIEPIELLPTFSSPDQGQTVKVTLHPVEFIVPDVRPSDSQPLFARSRGAVPAGVTTLPTPSPAAAAPPAVNYGEGFMQKPVNSLRVAKLERALNAEGNLTPSVDQDHFRLRIKALPGGTTGSVQLRTTKADGTTVLDAATKLNLTMEQVSPDYSTKPLLLVSDTSDDSGSDVTVKADEAPDDQTHLAELGSKIIVDSFDLKFPNPATAVTLPVTSLTATVLADPAKTFNVKIFRLSDCPLSKATILTHATRMKERFAQVGVTITAPTTEASIIDVSTPADWAPRGSIIELNNGKVLAKQDFLANQYPNPVDGKAFHVYYCKHTVLDGDAGGFAIYENDKDTSNRAHERKAYISGEQATLYVLAHEIGHLLTKAGHYGGTSSLDDYEKKASLDKIFHNLMLEGTGIGGMDIRAPKRLFEVQENLIFR